MNNMRFDTSFTYFLASIRKILKDYNLFQNLNLLSIY